MIGPGFLSHHQGSANSECAMRVKNTSSYPSERIKDLLRFAFRGVQDAGVEVHVKGSSRGARGYAYGGIPSIANVAKDARYLVTVGLPKDKELPTQTWGTKSIKKLFPEGIPLENWEDVLVYIGAHEARHIWQVQRKRRTGKGGKREYDADKFSYRRLNDWRVATDRDPIPKVKQPNPFETRLQAKK